MKIPVRTGTPDENPGLENAYGCYDVDTATIWMNDDVPPQSLEFWKTHEVLHAMLNNSGVLYATSSLLGIKRNDPRMEEWEEVLVRILTPHILETFGAALIAAKGTK